MINLTDSAKNYIHNQCKQSGNRFVKLTVKGGGCAGFSYEYSYSNAPEKDDYVININDESGFIVDSLSLLYVLGTNIDYINDLGGSSLKISNPNQTASCGCGKSFAV